MVEDLGYHTKVLNKQMLSKPGMAIHISNPNYAGGRDRKIEV
jgi:hypothetical protein